MEYKLKSIAAASAIAMSAAITFGAGGAAASTVLISKTFDGNDCAGYFGQGFGSCTIFIGEGDNRIELSPVIAKFDIEGAGAETEQNTGLYPSVDGSEFSLTGTGGSSGTWSYTPGEDDPGVRYWAAKGGNFFNLFWTVTSADNTAYCTGGDVYNIGCLSAALVVNSGDWYTPINPANGQRFDLSHLTFYDTEIPPIPLPAAGWLLLGGLGALAAVRRRRRPA